MPQGKTKTKVKIPDHIKTKSTHRLAKNKVSKKNRPKKSKQGTLLQKEVEKEIRKNIESEARARAKL